MPGMSAGTAAINATIHCYRSVRVLPLSSWFPETERDNDWIKWGLYYACRTQGYVPERTLFSIKLHDSDLFLINGKWPYIMTI
jgi:hypothetical protein